jgi:hypothetical protein
MIIKKEDLDYPRKHLIKFSNKFSSFFLPEILKHRYECDEVYRIKLNGRRKIRGRGFYFFISNVEKKLCKVFANKKYTPSYIGEMSIKNIIGTDDFIIKNKKIFVI